ncbi:MAG: hypothetical protein HY067_16715 [Betaproteobacteria bacterium]|nr:hypothetical protein [Betaproteobacteria bacterium]
MLPEAAVGVRLIVEHPVHTIQTNVHATEVVVGAVARKPKLVGFVSTIRLMGSA